jgi:hypothetical protein
MIASTGKLPRIAYCECGARLAGGSEHELFDVAERHIARDHPQWLPQRRSGSLSLAAPARGTPAQTETTRDRGR